MLEGLKTEVKGPIVTVDGGGSLMPAHKVPEAEVGQREAKAKLIAQAWMLQGMDAVALSSNDWLLGKDAIDGIVAETQLPVLAANLDCGGVHPFPASKVVERDGVRIGIVGVTAGDIPGCTLGDPIEGLRTALAELPPTDVTIALIPLNHEQMQQVASADLAVDFEVDAEGRMGNGPSSLGTIWRLESGTRGKQVGIATIEFHEGADSFYVEGGDDELVRAVDRAEKRVLSNDDRLERATTDADREKIGKQLATANAQLEQAKADLAAYRAGSEGLHHQLTTRVVPLGAEIADHAPTKAMVDEVEAGFGAAVAPVVAGGPHIAPDGSAYAGADTCKACHGAEHEQWGDTPHARAFAGLAKDNSQGDLACVGCHSTGNTHGANVPDGISVHTPAVGLRDVQCEACHGPASAHVANPASSPIPVAKPDTAVCTSCHDGQRDDGRFDAATYMPKVVHLQK